MTVGCMRVAYLVPKATNTQSEYAVLNCISTTTTVVCTNLNVTFHVYFLCCFS